ncbi:hypothetical protein EK21DRAFT_26460, partial [Setomelanomma holmii]
MADARTLLRQQRAARQQAQKHQKQSAAPAAVPTSKKRKAADESVEERKRTRTKEEAGVPAGFFDAGAEKVAEEGTTDPSSTTHGDLLQEDTREPELSTPQAPPLDSAAEAELDAFLNEMQQERPPPAATYASGAVIEAKPMTAAEIAAQAREDQSAQRARKDEEMEGEKEDAARALEDEFEEMEGLEERVKKLREQREALRLKHTPAAIADVAVPTAPPVEEDESESD